MFRLKQLISIVVQREIYESWVSDSEAKGFLNYVYDYYYYTRLKNINRIWL